MIKLALTSILEYVERIKMLTNTLRKNIKTIKKYDREANIVKYATLARFGANEPAADVSEIIVKDKMEEMFDESCIVEDTSQLIVKFPIVLDVQPDEKLPFFKSISYKLAKIFN